MSRRPMQLLSLCAAVMFLGTAATGQEGEKRREFQSKEQDVKPAIKFLARILDTRCEGTLYEFFMSDDGQLAVSVELQSEETARYALWDLTDGKLVRYLAAEEGAGVKAYAGADDADFGVKTVFSQRGVRRIVFAPGRGLIAALTIAAHPKLTPQKLRYELLVWEASTGELKRKIITNAGHHPHTFFFVNPKHILAKAFSEEGVSLQLIDASTGNIDYLIKDVNFEMYGGSVHGELVSFAAAGGQMFAINWRNKEQIDYERPPAGSSSYAADRTWYSDDGEFLYARKHGNLQVWSAKTKKFLRETRLADEDPIDLLLVADKAGLMARRRQAERTLELIDVTSNKTAAALILPYHHVALAGISHDATRFAIPTDNRQMLLLDFAEGQPAGVISGVRAANEAKEKVLR